MCGIVGFWNPEGVSPSLLTHIEPEHLVRSLNHRGPSSEHHAVFKNSKGLPKAMLGTARLAIIGLENGEQPIASPCGRWFVSMNGEIYNHNTLRRECIGNDHTPLNDSDTSVVAALLSFLPLDRVIDRLRGMFALAIYDTRTDYIRLYRDRVGQKPLYWTKIADTIVWSSELRTLESVRKNSNVRMRLNDSAISNLLSFEYIPAPLTIWEDIHKLQPGQYLHFGPETSPSTVFYWNLTGQSTITGSSRLHWEQSIQMALRSATQLRTEADVEVGTLLSSGIDSTTITSLASSIHPSIKSFSIAIDADGFSEQMEIEDNILHLQKAHNIDSKILRFNEEDFRYTLEQVLEHMDEPLADSSLIVTWFLFEQIKKQGLNCVLSGDGADEIFGGYPTYRAAQLLQMRSRFPNLGLRSKLSPLVQRIPSSTKGITWEMMLKRFCSINQDGSLPWWKEHQLWMGAWDPKELLHSENIWDVTESWANLATSDRVGNAMFLDHRMYLSEGVLAKVDRASMAHGVEVRSPFLDHHIIDLVNQVPLKFKINRFGDKQILRSLFPELPKHIRHRKKKGFGSPTAQWMMNARQSTFKNLPERVESWIPPKTLKKYIKEHKEGSHNHRRQLWSALILGEWLERHH